LSASKRGYASLDLSWNPSERLSPNTRIVFIREAVGAAVDAACAHKTDNMILTNGA